MVFLRHNALAFLVPFRARSNRYAGYERQPIHLYVQGIRHVHTWGEVPTQGSQGHRPTAETPGIIQVISSINQICRFRSVLMAW